MKGRSIGKVWHAMDEISQVTSELQLFDLLILRPSVGEVRIESSMGTANRHGTYLNNVLFHFNRVSQDARNPFPLHSFLIQLGRD